MKITFSYPVQNGKDRRIVELERQWSADYLPEKGTVITLRVTHDKKDAIGNTHVHAGKVIKGVVQCTVMDQSSAEVAPDVTVWLQPLDGDNTCVSR